MAAFVPFGGNINLTSSWCDNKLLYAISVDGTGLSIKQFYLGVSYAAGFR
jgi:hypothetical protein